MDSVQKTLYIPLYSKAYVSKKGLFLRDTKAEEIWAAEKFTLKGKSKSKWLAYYMGIRAAVFDEWVKTQLAQTPNATILHIGCGMDSRVLRVGAENCSWFDVDFPQVIAERKRYFVETANYRMLSGDIRDGAWLEKIPKTQNAIVVMEGVSMYLTEQEIQTLITRLRTHFRGVALLVDCYTTFGAKMSKYKNPVKDVGVTQVYGLDDSVKLQQDGFVCVGEREMTPSYYVNELKGMEKFIFRKVYGGSFAKKIYRLYEYKTVEEIR